ncbi:AbiA family abortive infection protein, partial [Fulvivirga sediminis]
MSTLKETQVGYFLTYDLWKSAKDLLDYQINDRKDYKIYNTFNFLYFEQVIRKTERLKSKAYYNERISNNLFYGFEREFFLHKYTIPKIGAGLRNYYFFSYPMQQLMYAFGLYILRVTHEFLTGEKGKKIKSFYGGDLKFEKNKLVLKEKTTLYYSRYKEFKSELQEVTEDPEDKIIIRLDIQDYYDNISIKKLLDLIEINVKSSVLKKNNFDSATKEQIEFYYRFLSDGIDNIPQSDNNIISGFIGYLYLTFGDLIIEDVINELNEGFRKVDYRIVRYVDDIYVSLDFKHYPNFELKFDKELRYQFVQRLLNKIADKFHAELNLRFNNKVQVFEVGNADERNRFRSLMNKVSEDYPEAQLKKGLSPSEQFTKLLNVTDDIKQKGISKFHKNLDEFDRETLKYVYDKHVLNLIQNNIPKLERKFKDFNYELLHVYPQPLIILISACTEALESLESHLLSKSIFTTFDLWILLVLLSQPKFSNRGALFKKLGESEKFRPVFEFIRSKKVSDNANTGYYSVNFRKMKQIINYASFVEQIRQRVFAERQNYYSVSLNHLLNEIHFVCYVSEGEKGEIKNYNAGNVEQYLKSIYLDNNTVIQIRNLFDRRNNNPISHAGSDSRIAWGVSKQEYYVYKGYVSKVLDWICNKKLDNKLSTFRLVLF